jgi:hypothetical protein
MTSNFTVIVFQRQHFGNNPGSFDDVEPDVPFAGAAKAGLVVVLRVTLPIQDEPC